MDPGHMWGLLVICILWITSTADEPVVEPPPEEAAAPAAEPVVEEGKI